MTENRSYRVWVEGRLPSTPVTARDAMAIAKLWEGKEQRVAIRTASWDPRPYAPIMRWDGFPS